MKEQTAIEYLLSEITNPSGDKTIPEIIEECKEIQRKNIIDAFEKDGVYNGADYEFSMTNTGMIIVKTV